MREILFRGKRIDNGEWVYGFYFCMHHDDDREHIHHFIIPLNVPIPKDKPIGEIQVEVDPTTIGQYTGLTANGKKIFEGDILQIYEGSEDDGYKIREVYSYRGVLCVDYETSEWDFNALAFLDSDNVFTFEVIGNIHDNPELMEVN